MSIRPGALVLLALVAAVTDAATAAGTAYQPLRPLSECLAPERARGFHVLDSHQLLVDVGRRHYLIELSWSCNELGSHRALAFRTRNPAGRICGDIGDAVVPQQGGGGVLARCDISRITRLSGDEAAAERRRQRAPASAALPR